MDRRTLFALLLTAIVIVVTPMLFPSPKRATGRVDSTRPAPTDTGSRGVQPAAPEPSAAPPARTERLVAPNRSSAAPETTTVQTTRSVYHIISPGGTPAQVTLLDYPSLRPGAASRAPVNLLENGDRLFHLRLIRGADTVALDTIGFRASPARTAAGALVQEFTSTSPSVPLTLSYRFPSDSFLVHVTGRLSTTNTTPTDILVSLPQRVHAEERDVRDDTRHLAVAYKRGNDEAQSIAYRAIDAGSARIDTGAIRWVAERNKYFVVAALPATPDASFRALSASAGLRTGPEATAATVSVLMRPAPSGFAFRIYAGPQSWNHLRRTASDLENVNPYGGWLHGVVQPFATIVMRLLLWIRHALNVGYGWVLVIFGVAVRLLLWPLNQNAMRSSMKLQRIQPELTELQKKYRNDPEKQRDAILKLYQQHGMSPFTPVLGCLPMLLPMPILFALYFVFQNTIELRGVPFLWLPDLSLRDPYFITPLFMGLSMFGLSWLGMRGMPPSPQGKMMSYVMPVMFTALFWNFASGLNLYYAVQNVAALPQQWLLARERATTAGTGAKGTSREKS